MAYWLVCFEFRKRDRSKRFHGNDIGRPVFSLMAVVRMHGYGRDLMAALAIRAAQASSARGTAMMHSTETKA